MWDSTRDHASGIKESVLLTKITYGSCRIYEKRENIIKNIKDYFFFFLHINSKIFKNIIFNYKYLIQLHLNFFPSTIIEYV